MQRDSADERLAALGPIFVIGAPRSGTTLVGKILGQHANVFSPGESHYFEDIWSRRQELGSLQSATQIREAVSRLMTVYERYNFPDAQRFVNECVNSATLMQMTMQAGGGYAMLYRTFMAMLAECAGKSRICDDTPKHLYYVADITRLLPDAKFIGCIRDPRDFLFSYRNYWRRSTESARIKALYHPVVTSILWRSSVKSLLQRAQQLGPSRMMLLQYEQLVESPAAVVRKMCHFLDLEYDDNLLLVRSENSSFAQETSGIFSTSVGRWRTGLPAEETWWCQYFTKDYMAEFAMQREPLNASRVALLTTLASTPLAFMRALNANREKRGPLLGYLLRRLRAL